MMFIFEVTTTTTTAAPLRASEALDFSFSLSVFAKIPKLDRQKSDVDFFFVFSLGKHRPRPCIS